MAAPRTSVSKVDFAVSGCASGNVGGLDFPPDACCSLGVAVVGGFELPPNSFFQMLIVVLSYCVLCVCCLT